jgi:hypothetical protein
MTLKPELCSCVIIRISEREEGSQKLVKVTI